LLRDRARGYLAAVLVLPALAPPAAAQQPARPLSAREQEKAAAIEAGRQALVAPRFQEAEEAFQRAARLDPDDPLPRVWLARTIFLQRKGDLEKALAELDRALRSDRRDKGARYWKGRVLQRLGSGRNLNEARALFAGLVEEDPLYEDALWRLQQVHVERGSLADYLAERAEAARRTPNDPMTTYRYAEALRQSGELGRAEALLRALRESRRDFAPDRVDYSLALVLFDQQRWEEGTEAYLEAVRNLRDEATARAMWEDAYLIANLDQARRFRAARTVEDYREFLLGFWKSRDPTKTTLDNERIGVHYERLAVCWRSYRLGSSRRAFNDPDTEGRLNLPPTYDIEAPFNDMGLIYLRWGEPDDKAWYHAENVPENMSWKYDANSIHDAMTFHFEQNAFGGGWRFVPYPRPGEYALSRTSLDAKYGSLQHGPDQQAQNRLQADANRDLREGLTKDGFTIPEHKAEPLTVYTDWAVFRATPDLSRLEVYWGIPLLEAMSQAVVSAQEMRFDIGIALFDENYRQVYQNQRVRTVSIPRGTPEGAMSVDQEVILVPPGRYNLALQIREEVGEKLQIQEAPNVDVRGFPAGELGLSDIQIALNIREGERPPFIKPGYTVTPLPTRVYPPAQTTWIYFDIYGLAKDEVNATRYRVSYRIDPVGAERGALGRVSIGGRTGRQQGMGGIAVEGDEESGISSDVHRALNIDVGESSVTTYRLRVTVEDLVSGRQVERTTVFYRSTSGGQAPPSS
jgi:tetratricopeptide (TPR) repeat protein